MITPLAGPQSTTAGSAAAAQASAAAPTPATASASAPAAFGGAGRIGRERVPAVVHARECAAYAAHVDAGASLAPAERPAANAAAAAMRLLLHRQRRARSTSGKGRTPRILGGDAACQPQPKP